MTTQTIERTSQASETGFISTINATLVEVGDRFGFYRIMSESDPLTSFELAERTGVPERDVRMWLRAQADEGFVYHDAATGRFSNSCPLPRLGHSTDGIFWTR